MKYAKIKDSKIEKIHDLKSKRRTIRDGNKKYANPKAEHYEKAGWLPVVDAIMTENQKLGAPIIGTTEVTYEIIDKTTEELTGELTNYIKMMDDAARQYIDDSAHWTAGPLIFDNAKRKTPKSLAIKNWTEAVWAEFFKRMDLLLAGTAWADEMLDFSSVGPIPYTIREAMAEQSII